MNDENRSCQVCGGSRAEHYDEAGKPITQHVYNPDSTDMITHAQQAQARRSLAQRFTQESSRMGGDTDDRPFRRLVEVLRDKRLLNDDETLYIAGYSEKPKTQQFRDPSMMPLAGGEN